MIAFQQATLQRFALAGHYYTSPEILRQETQRIFSNHWLCIGRSEQIPDPGDYFLAEVGNENLIILRDLAGIARAFFNICRHRGKQLCTQNQGHLMERIQCPYHAWSYSLEGQLQATRQMQQGNHATTDYPLYACALHEWEGFLWINLATNPAPFAQTFAPLLNRFTPWQMANLRSTQQITYTVNANWKLIFQNYSECHRCLTPQPQRTRSAALHRQNDLQEGAFLGGYLTLSRWAMPPRQADCPDLPGIQGENRNRAYYYSLFPTMLLSLYPNFVITHRLYPLAPDQTQVLCEWLFAPEPIAQPHFDASDAIESGDLMNRQNWRNCELTQARADRVPPSPTHSEGLLAAFDQEYLRVMGA